jgi:hypothetical protein
MSAQKPMQGLTLAIVFIVEGEISRSRSSHVVRIVRKGLPQEPSYAEGPASQMEPNRVTTWKFLNKG